MSKTALFGYARLALWSWLGFTLAQGCASADNGSLEPPLHLGGNSFISSGGRSIGEAGTQVIMPNLGAGKGGGGAASALCGVASCVPDQSLPHPGDVDYVDPGCGLPAQRLELAGGAGGAGGAAAGHEGVAGAGGERNPPGTRGDAGTSGNADGGASASSGSGNLTSAGEAGNAGRGLPNSACQVVWSDKSHRVTASCGDSGSGELASPCFTGADCKPGLACVKESAISSCRPYCCLGQSSCDPIAGSYCAERPLVDASLPKGSAPMVPVCVPADRCDLDAPYPCPEGQVCECSGEKACLVVRSDGATACAEPGTGDTGQACPCQHGNVCAASTSTCLALCRLDQSTSVGCNRGTCQPSPQLPLGFGVCVDD